MHRFFIVLLVLVVTVSMAGMAAAVDPWVNYTETDLGSNWLYQFTIVNPITSGDAVFDMLIETSSGVINASPIATGTGWQFNYVSLSGDQIHWFSPSVPTDVTAGSSLGGFSFQTSSQYTGDFAYTLGGSSLDYTGNAQPAVVPEPGTMIASLALLSPMGLPLLKRFRKSRSQAV
jgi:hypothetical protein